MYKPLLIQVSLKNFVELRLQGRGALKNIISKFVPMIKTYQNILDFLGEACQIDF